MSHLRLTLALILAMAVATFFCDSIYIFNILLFVGAFVYIVGGMVFKHYKQGETGNLHVLS